MISIYIVTYKNDIDLNNNIASILASGADVRINVINNHSDFFLKPEHEKEVNVLHNSLRPDFSTGHLARNWNQALLHGFQDLKKPASDIVITVQDDVMFKPDWLPNLIDLHREYTFITMGTGDAFCSYLPEAVRKIGLWDERFCNIGYQEADYFLRALIYNSEKSSINDLCHTRLHNAVDGNVVNLKNLSISHNNSSIKGAEFELISTPHSNSSVERSESLLITTPIKNIVRHDIHESSRIFSTLALEVFMKKWGVNPGQWTEECYSLSKSLIPNYITYPYFEKDIECLREKNYIISDEY